MLTRLLHWSQERTTGVLAQIETEEMAATAVAKAKQYAPVKTGQLKASIAFQMTPNGEAALIYASAPYAGFVHDGTKPHVIEARNAQALRFPGNAGLPVYRRRVNHPGTQPNRFLERAIEETIAEQSRLIGLRSKLRRWMRGGS